MPTKTQLTKKPTSESEVTLADIMSELKAMGTAQTIKTLRNNGANGDLFGVKIGDMKKLLKKIMGNQALAMELWDTNNSDAMYLAGLAADGAKMTKKQLDHWAKTAWWHMLSEYSVPFVTAENPEVFSIAKKWIESKKESIATSGWNSYSLGMSYLPDDRLDLDEICGLMKQVETKIHESPNRVRYCMNGFVIGAGSAVETLFKDAVKTAKAIGEVHVDVGNTSCKIPNGIEALQKIESMGRVGKKRASTKC